MITAICPVLHRSEEFSSEKVKLPMFWVNYKDLVPYLTQTKVSVSNYNNAANSTWDDFFTARLYKGDIYKTTNLQNRTLSQYCPTDSAMVKEQKRIEKELVDFEKDIVWQGSYRRNGFSFHSFGNKNSEDSIRRKGGVTMLLQPKSKSSSSSKLKSSAGKSQSVSKRGSSSSEGVSTTTTPLNKMNLYCSFKNKSIYLSR